MDKINVLICDGDRATHDNLALFLDNEDISHLSVCNGEDVFKILRQKKHVDLIITEVVLPTISGLEVCRKLREKSSIPIIFLSKLCSESDRIAGLKLGADDYICKPFSAWEVAVRVQTIIRRTHPPKSPAELLSYADITLNTDSYQLYIDDKKIKMTAKEVELLSFFIKNADVVLERERILNEVWGYDYYGDSRVVDTQVKRLRNKLKNEDAHFEICSIYGIGYKLEKI